MHEDPPPNRKGLPRRPGPAPGAGPGAGLRFPGATRYRHGMPGAANPSPVVSEP